MVTCGHCSQFSGKILATPVPEGMMQTRSLMVPLSVAIGLLVCVHSVRAQTDNNPLLASVDSVDAEINLTWAAGIPNEDQNTMRSRLQTVFELELRQRGVRVSKSASNVLIISLVTLYHEGLVAYSYSLTLSEPGLPQRVITEMLVADVFAESKRSVSLRPSDSVRASLEMRARLWDGFWQAYYDTSKTKRWITTWSGPSGVATVGRNKLRESLEGETAELAQAFVNAYLAVHPQPNKD